MVEIELYVTDITLCDKSTNEVKMVREYQKQSFRQCQQIAKDNNSVLVSKKTSKQKFTVNPDYLTQTQTQGN